MPSNLVCIALGLVEPRQLLMQVYRLFKRHGRWRSETAKDGYVKDSMSALMSVSEL